MRSLHFVLSWLPVVWSQMVELQGMPPGLPSPPPSYMVDNQGNTFGAAPDKGVLNGPVTSIFNDLNRTISNVTDAAGKTLDHTLNSVLNRRASGYWLAEMGDQGQVQSRSKPQTSYHALILPDALRTFGLQILSRCHRVWSRG